MTQTTLATIALILLIGGFLGIEGTLYGMQDAKMKYEMEEREKYAGLIIRLDGSGELVFQNLDFSGRNDDKFYFNNSPFDSMGTWTGINFSGVSGDYNNYNTSGPQTPSKYFIQTDSGANIDYLSVTGGTLATSFNTAFTDFRNQTPTHYMQDTAGLSKIDTTQTTLNIGYNGYIGIGTSASASPLNLNGLATTAPIGTSATGYLCIDSSNNVYRKASCP